jgi:RNA-directed DNA polymerase
MRCCYWKQWRWPRTKINHLVSLGASLKEAIKTGVSSKGPYAMSRTPITQMAMNNEWLKAQGLVSIKDQWVRFYYPVSTA